MATVIALDASPVTILRQLRGRIVDARVAYPDVLHVEIRDANGGVWRFATQDAEWSPTEPARLVGHSIEGVHMEELTGDLRFRLSDGAVLDVKPSPVEAADDPPCWEAISPAGIVLEYGPGLRWQVSRAAGPAR